MVQAKDCPSIDSKKKDDQGNIIVSAGGETFIVPPGHILVCNVGKWEVVKQRTPPPPAPTDGTNSPKKS